MLIGIPSQASAQQALSFSQIQVEIWPEYDQPAVLVIYRGQLTMSAGSGPVQVELRIPAGAGEPNAVAFAVDGQLFNAPYNRVPEGEWALIQFETEVPGFQLEYYDQALSIEAENRHYQFIWPGDAAVQDFSLIVQQPAGAAEFLLNPALPPAQVGGNGLNYYQGSVGSLAAGQSFALDVHYQKFDDRLTLEQLEGGAPLDSEAVNSSVLPSANLWLGGLILIGLIGALVYWVTASQRLRRSRVKPRRGQRGVVKPSARRAQAKLVNADAKPVYCQDCGQRSQAQDQFCRSCGTKLRR